MREVGDLLQDLRLSTRRLRNSPLYTGIIVLSLGLGIGANLAVFHIVNTVLFRPLDVREPEALVAVYNQNARDSNQYSSSAWPDFDHFREHSKTLDLAAYARLPFLVQFGGEFERVSGEFVSDNYFQVLGAQALIGRTMTPGEIQTTAPVILSASLWRRKFGADHAILGRALRIGRQMFTVMGVMPLTFRGVVLDWGDPPELWIPLRHYAEAVPALATLSPERQRGMHWLLMTGRLKPGRTVEQAQTELRVLASRLPPVRAATHLWLPLAVPLQEGRFWIGDRSTVIRFMTSLTAIVAVILLITLLNVGNMVLARAAAREKEFAMRAALGASRWRLLRESLAEHLLFAVLASLAASAIANWTVDLMSSFGGWFALRQSAAQALDFKELAAGILLALVAAGLMSMVAARPAWRTELNDALKRTTAGASGTQYGLRRGLIVAQAALSTVLIIASSLFVRTVESARAEDRTNDAGNVLKATLDLVSPAYGEEAGTRTWREVIASVRELPGVAAAALVWNVPLGGMRGATDIIVDPASPKMQVDLNVISPGYFSTIGVRLLRGQDFSNADKAGAADVVIVNQLLAERLWPGQEAVGKRIRSGTGEVWEVVGTVPDRKMRSVRSALPLTVYRPVFQQYRGQMTLQVRTSENPLRLIGPLQAAIRKIAPDAPLFGFETMQAHLNTALARERMTAALAGVLGSMAVALLSVGLYGLVAFYVLRRTREIGIRIALGARRGQIVLLVLGHAASLILLGICIGIPLAAGVSRLVSGLLYGVGPMDPTSFAAGVLILLAAGCLATIAPAWRAGRVDPASALRSE